MIKTGGMSFYRGIRDSKHKVNINQRHYPVRMIPEEYRDLPKYTILREPEDWYLSFYNFFGPKRVMMYFIGDKKQKDLRMMNPSNYNQFIENSMNLKETLLRDPWRLRLLNTTLRRQGCGNWSSTYILEEPSIDNPSSLDQFDMSLFEWIYLRMGMDRCINIPLSNMKELEEIFDINLEEYVNPTKNKLIEKNYVNNDTKDIIRKVDKKYYELYNNLINKK